MRVLFKWLGDHVDMASGAAEIADKLTMAGLEVEAIIDLKDSFRGVKTGRVLEIAPVKGADTLKLCSVSIGDQVLSIICGAPNVEKGQNVFVALPGHSIPAGAIEKAVIRGIESHGMLCSEKELGLAVHSDGIVALPGDIAPGLSIWQVYPDLDDTAIEVGITPNRGDCLSHIGIAREIAAVTGKRLKPAATAQYRLLDKAEFIGIEIRDPELCPRYTAKLIRNVEIKPSPVMLKARLFGCGMRPINNVVDITNYIMLDMGQPLHAFDYALLEGRKIIVRTAAEGEPFTTLDGKERPLLASDLVIADGNRPVALAGVMGGANSEVSDQTRDILLESAYFNPVSIRKTARRLGMQSEASYRFERAVDFSSVPAACEKAAQMMGRYAGGSVADGVVDCNPGRREMNVIRFRPARCGRYLGNETIGGLMKERLASLGFGVDDSTAGAWDVEVPLHRTDVTIEEDLYEEVARTGFYADIPSVLPPVSMRSRGDFADSRGDGNLRNALADLGVSEVITYSFIAEKELRKILFPEARMKDLVYMMNPLAEEPTVMRPSLLPSHLAAAELNHSRGNLDFSIFEIGKRYGKGVSAATGLNTVEDSCLHLVFSGLAGRKAWYEPERPYDFFAAKGVIELLLLRLGKLSPEAKNIPPALYPWLHPLESCELLVEGEVTGVLGSVHPEVAARYDLKRELYVAEINLDLLKRLVLKRKISYTGYSKFPSVERDITVVVGEDVTSRVVKQMIEQGADRILKNVSLIDLFRGEKIGAGKKSLTYRLLYQAEDRTLSDEEVNRTHEAMTEKLLDAMAIELSK